MSDTDTRTREILLERPTSLVPPHAAAPLSTLEEAPPSVPCANCGDPLVGPYCAQCGQHVADYHRSVWRFVVDFFDSSFCWDNKLLRTLGPLFKQPGFLTREFMLGRRVRYVHPLKLFLFTSAVCLTLLQYSQNQMIHFVGTPKDGDKTKKGFHVNFDEPNSATAAPGTSPTVAKAPTEADDGDVDKAADEAADKVRRAMAKKAARKARNKNAATDDLGDKIVDAVDTRIDDMGEERFNRAVIENFQQRLSWVALTLLPVFALGMRALYWRKENFYFEHLIFSLHYHTFLFLFWTVYIAVLAVANHLPLHSLLGALARLALLLPALYLFVALRRMYGDGPKRTFFKMLALGSMHLLAICIGVAAVGAAAFFTAK